MIPQLLQNGLQNGLVSHVAIAIRPADEDAVFLPGLLPETAQNGLVDLHLGSDGGINGELPLDLFKNGLPQLLPQCAVPDEAEHPLRQSFHIPRLHQKSRLPIDHNAGNRTHAGGNGGAVHPGALWDGIGQAL